MQESLSLSIPSLDIFTSYYSLSTSRLLSVYASPDYLSMLNSAYLKFITIQSHTKLLSVNA